MTQARLWFARAVMLYALAIFGYLAALYVLEPQAHIARFGVAISGAPESLNFLRTGPGAMFSALAVTALYGLARRQYFLACLWFIVVLNACVVGGRLYGIATDGVSPMQFSELRDEGLSWLLFVAALAAFPRTRTGS
jgi:hypothetical protein